jgi:hypothetical protein
VNQGCAVVAENLRSFVSQVVDARILVEGFGDYGHSGDCVFNLTRCTSGLP